MNGRTVRVIAAVVGGAVLLLAGLTVAFAKTPASSMFNRMMDTPASSGMMGSSTMMNGAQQPGMMNGNGHTSMMNGSSPMGMMGNGGHAGMMNGLGQGSATGKSISMDRARESVQNYIDKLGGKNLAIDEVMEFQRNFYAIIKDTSTGHGVLEVLVNKNTGTVFLEFGPSMMWNTQYGMMSRGMGHMMGYQQPTGPMTVSVAKAEEVGGQWLDKNKQGVTAEAPDQFPGYYTIHFLRDGKIAGMLSINGYTGQVWNHVWHGVFIR